MEDKLSNLNERINNIEFNILTQINLKLEKIDIKLDKLLHNNITNYKNTKNKKINKKSIKSKDSIEKNVKLKVNLQENELNNIEEKDKNIYSEKKNYYSHF